MFGHIAALGFYAVLAMAFLFRLLPLWSTHIPGGLQDTRFLLWNDWWFRYAIDTLHTNPFHTSLLYHPFGTSLILTDSPLWNSLVTYAAQNLGANLLASANWSFILSWILMGFVTYLLAWEITRRQAPALVAGLFVMTHSFILSCAMQNWTRFNLFGIPLFLWTLVRARRSERWQDYILSGAALAWTAACHYYFLVYSLLIWSLVVIADYFPLGFRFLKRKSPSQAPWGRAGLVIAVLAGAIASWIIVGHPADLVIGKTRIGLETPYNALLVMWTGLFLRLASGWTVERFSRKAFVKPLPGLRKHLALLATAGICLLPLLIPMARMALHGEYPRQSILWKTHRPGANLVSFILPNPMHVLWGPAVSRWFTSRDMIVQEQAAGLGWVLIALLMMTRPWRLGTQARRWLGLAVGSSVLAMGSYFHVAQWNLWLPLPFYFLRLLPVVGNARIPDHWMTVGAVAWAVILSLALLKLADEKKWPLNKLCAIAGALVLLENWPGIPFVPPPAREPVYETLRGLPPGAVLTVPMYVGDSIIGVGDSLPARWIFPWDHLWAQTEHQKPILGGYIGRISRSLITSYKADPFIATLLDLEENKIQGHAPDPAAARQAVQTLNFKYVLVYPSAADAEALQYVLGSLPLELVDQGNGIQLYRVRG